ncbi:hypothetical protein LSAT2_027546 [Lamellibrachia satsuma]|nr:hypothetical protein LSAT2_027546 [Lamellibrachia satsuma]
MFSDGTLLYQLSLTQRSISKLPIGPQRGIFTLAVDPVEMKVYWTEIHEDILRRANINGTGKEDVSRACGIGARPLSIAVDVISRLLYYQDFNNGAITAMTLDGRYSFTVVTDMVYGAYSMALYPARGMLYWCEGRGMMAAGMDGSDQFILDRDIHNVFSLTVDTKGDRLYWYDGANIRSLSIEGGYRGTAAQSVSNYGLTTLGHNLYYSTLVNGTEERIQAATRASSTTVHFSSKRVVNENTGDAGPR